MATNDRALTNLMSDIENGKLQLPDFQRGWVWDDNRIKALVASITNSYPVGAAMFLAYNEQNLRFKYREIEGAPKSLGKPIELILDGQQRLTSIYASLYNKNAVHTKTDKGKEIYRYYYIDIKKSLDPLCDREEAILSVPDNKFITTNFGKEIKLDLRSRELEFKNKLFPLNIILDFAATNQWQNEYMQYYNQPDEINLICRFVSKIAVPLLQYQIPVILLGADTPKEAVCQVFENVNTGGVSLTVFELVTAIYAMDDFPLREDWDNRKKQFFNTDLLWNVSATDFLTACTLFAKLKNKQTVSCKKKDVLNLSLKDYKNCADSLTKGFQEAERLLEEERIFGSNNLPYSTQLIPLSVICTILLTNNAINSTSVRQKVKQWYWCGVFGELYGGANETRYANDVVDVIEWIIGNGTIPRTIQESYFNPLRLLTLKTRISAAYKGIMALILKHHCKDFISGREMDFVLFKSENIDIHHVFPKKYCLDNGFPESKWNSIVNKTPLIYLTNREIGGVAPSVYLNKIEQKSKATSAEIDSYLNSHWLDAKICRQDDFGAHIIYRASKLLDAIERATGKKITGRDSEEVRKAFGGNLL